MQVPSVPLPQFRPQPGPIQGAYGWNNASVGVKQPIGGSNPGSHSNWLQMSKTTQQEEIESFPDITQEIILVIFTLLTKFPIVWRVYRTTHLELFFWRARPDSPVYPQDGKSYTAEKCI